MLGQRETTLIEDCSKIGKINFQSPLFSQKSPKNRIIVWVINLGNLVLIRNRTITRTIQIKAVLLEDPLYLQRGSHPQAMFGNKSEHRLEQKCFSNFSWKILFLIWIFRRWKFSHIFSNNFRCRLPIRLLFVMLQTKIKFLQKMAPEAEAVVVVRQLASWAVI